MNRWLLTGFVLCLAATGLGQGWQKNYERGVLELQAGNFAAAKAAFCLAYNEREDISGKTYIRGSITERRVWRGGEPYSPRFLAGYAAYKQALLAGGNSRDELLAESAQHFTALLDAHRASQAAYALLAIVLSLQGDEAGREHLKGRYSAEGADATFRVDLSAVDPKDASPLAELKVPAHARKPAAASTRAATEESEKLNVTEDPPKSQPLEGSPVAMEPVTPSSEGATTDISGASTSQLVVSTEGSVDVVPTATVSTASFTPQQITGPVQPVVVQASNQGSAQAKGSPKADALPEVQLSQGVSSKFALIVGNSVSAMADGELPFAVDDAMRVKDVLMGSAGYPEQNIDVVVNATADQLAASINALTQRLSENSTVLIYFTGVGANIDGKDYLAGVDSEFASDGSRMLSKEAIYRAFASKGAIVFAFFQSNRPIQDGRYFGSEVPNVGRIAQVQATIPGSSVSSIHRDGRQTGLFTEAFVSVMARLKNDQVPILEFGWQVFNQIRRGDTGTTGGGSAQVPTLPVLTNLASDARF